MKNVKRLFVPFLAAFLLMAACSSSGYDLSGSAPRESGTGGAANAEEHGYLNMAASLSGEHLADNTAGRKIIWDASMDIEAEDAAALYSRLAARAAELGGYEHTNDTRHYERYSAVNATFKIPPQSVHAFMAYVEGEGKVINSRLGSEDITEGYHDARLRLETRRRSLEPYFNLLAGAKTVDEIIHIQRIIDGITEDIEALEGRLRMWDTLTEMATVSVTIRQENDPAGLRRDINWQALSLDDMGYLIHSGFVAVSSGIFALFQWILIALLVTSPLWIIALIVLLIVFKRLKKRRAAAARLPGPEASSPGDTPE
ncbi:MAG: DUF4349 domain-containing protein [Oscillospiraceae bacterium]|nr:DUF4349 domain-containing protein [Oscillospiraceae bacterium]